MARWQAKRTRRSSSRLHIGVPLALACLVFQLASATHFLLARHSLCLEHGEVVDARHSDNPRGLAAPSEVQTRSAIAASRPADPASHEHDHCLFAQLRRDPAAPRPAASPARDTSSTTSSRALLAIERAHAPIATLLVAPKSSPPISAST